MLANRTALTYADKRPTWVEIIKFLLLVVFVVALFLLAQSMVRHRFHRGGWINHHDRTTSFETNATSTEAGCGFLSAR